MEEKKMIDNELNGLEINSEEVQEIITAVPSWILRRGISLILGIILSIFCISAFIHYPDVVKTSLKINSLNAPKMVFAKQTGKIIALLVKEGQIVKQNQSLAFMESNGNHSDVIKLRAVLSEINNEQNSSGYVETQLPKGLNLGELQGAYQNFYQQYLQFSSAQKDGYYLSKKKYLRSDLTSIGKLKDQIISQREIQEKEYANVKQEFESYKKLYQKGVISTSEYKQQENKYLSGQYPLQQTSTALLNNMADYTSKKKEILDLDHIIQDERAKFVQSLSNMITETNAWINQHIMCAPVDGKVSFAGIVQGNQTVISGQELFMVNPANADFFGEVQIPQYNMGKVKIGQNVLVKMRSFPFEQYGVIRGKLNYISEVAFKDSVFIAKINFNRYENKDSEHKILLKNGMQGDVEIITEESSLLKRFTRNLVKMLNTN
ncbi:HlyD family efflux transporter periplasmic adaptor subunit [Pedobacter psychrodurus]|uniref:HlyD family efflux transporter periplasmic adaptor subunit n=1 Tax=Pedobacter psychrodurus TaxID=2530456 RepID=A0A4R0PZB7_9SPHI|nr:HlyD family efflux transporter periplasmic adaptor subunit [Pedobacter psychrodurus]TCD27798.1 HlyD family efflux transporter periplasmic adaptor subunit [Pedobacter psychrodurus]